MPRANEDIEALLQEYSDLISISGGDAYKARAYEKAARSVGGYHGDVATLDEEGLGKIPNVGKSIAVKIREYLETGAIDALHDGRLRGLPGFGLKTEENLLRGIQQMQRGGDRVLLGVAMDMAEEIL